MKKISLMAILILVFSSIVFAQSEAAPSPTPAPPAENQAEKASDEEAAEDEPPKYEVQFNYSQEALTNNLGVWKTASFHVQRKFSNRQIIWGGYRVSDRNGIRDNEITAGIYRPLKQKWAITAEANASHTHKYVGKVSVLIEVEKGFKNGWVAHVGSRFTKYDTVQANSSYGLLEKYWGSNRLAYTLYINSLTRAGTAPNHRLQYNRYYGEESNSIGAAVSFGREHESLGPLRGILKNQTWSVSFSERHWLTKKFGVNVDGFIHRQGGLYYRRGVNFGVRYRF